VWATTGVDETITIPTQNIGTFNAVVDWGDSSPPETITAYNGFSHVYDDIGEYTISITGTFPNIYMFGDAANAAKLKKVLNLGTVGWTALNKAFRGCNNLTEFTAGSTDTSSVTALEQMFAFCFGLTSLDLSSFDTSAVTNMTQMFYLCSSLASVDVSSFDTSSVANMSNLFNNCPTLTSMVGVEDWDITGLNSTGDLTNFLTGGKMTTAQYDNLLVNWRAQDPFNGMTPSFGASTYTGGSAAATARQELLDIDGWSIGDGGIEPSAFVSVWATSAINETITIPCQNSGTFNAVIDWGDGTPTSTITAYNDADLAHVYTDIDDYTISITGVFPNIYLNNGAEKDKIKKVLNLGTVGWTKLNTAFNGCTNLTEFTAGSTDTSNVTNFQQMFQSCSSLITANLIGAALDKASTMYRMFNACTALSSVTFNPASSMTQLLTTSGMFINCSSLTSIDMSSFSTGTVNAMSQTFLGTNSLTSMVGVEDWDITGLNGTGDLTLFLTSGKMTTAQYDNLLVKWEAQTVFSGMTPSFGASEYTGGGTAATARQDLIDIDGWSISDGGIA
jgi:surface protein